jgi:hypothetical protein
MHALVVTGAFFYEKKAASIIETAFKIIKTIRKWQQFSAADVESVQPN